MQRGVLTLAPGRRIDITEGIPKEASINWCKGCSRYLAPPTQWVICDMESRELLAICLRKLKGLSKVRLIDAGFIWTEPHSKRLRVKLTIQKEVRLLASWSSSGEWFLQPLQPRRREVNRAGLPGPT